MNFPTDLRPQDERMYARGWNAAIKAAAAVAANEWEQKPIVAPLTNAAYDEAACTIEAGILALKIGEAVPAPKEV